MEGREAKEMKKRKGGEARRGGIKERKGKEKKEDASVNSTLLSVAFCLFLILSRRYMEVIGP